MCVSSSDADLVTLREEQNENKANAFYHSVRGNWDFDVREQIPARFPEIQTNVTINSTLTLDHTLIRSDIMELFERHKRKLALYSWN